MSATRKLRGSSLRKQGKGWSLLLTFLLLFSVTQTGFAQPSPLQIPLVWNVDLNSYTEAGPTLANITGDWQEEVLVAVQKDVVALGSDGKELWRWHSKSRLMTYPSVLPRSGDHALIFFANTGGELVCLDGKGQKVWQTQLPPRVEWSAPVVCDLEGDGKPEVIQTDGKGKVHAFDALKGSEIWSATVQGVPVSPAVGDLDGDGNSEILVATGEGMATVLDSQGKKLWTRPIGGTSPTWATCAPIMFAASDGSVRCVAGSNASQIICFAADGSTLWSRETEGPLASGLSAGDMDGDGRADVFAVTQLGTIYRFDEDGALRWRIDMHNRCLAAGSLMDLDGDGLLDYSVCSQNGRLLILNARGEFIYDRQFDHRTINVTPAFGDVDAKRPGLEMVLTGGESGLVLCFGTPATANSRASWTAYRGDAGKTGAWLELKSENALSMTPTNLAWNRIHCGEPTHFLIHNPAGLELQASAVCQGPDGSRTLATTQILGKYGKLSLAFDGSAPGAYRFHWALANKKGKNLAAGEKQIQILPFANDIALGRKVVSQLEATAETVTHVLPASSKAIKNESAVLEQRLENLISLDQAAADSDTCEEAKVKTASFVADVRRDDKIANLIAKAADLGPGTSLIAAEGPLWDNRMVDERVPEEAASPLHLSHTAVPGEHAPASILVFNITDRAIEAQVKAEVSPAGPVVKIHRSLPVISSVGEQSWDPLPELDESSVITIPPLSSREVWVDIDAAESSPGEYQVRLKIAALNGVGVVEVTSSPQSVPAPVTTVQLQLHLLDFEMAPSGSLRLCAWATLDKPAIQDLLSHGGNVFVCPQGSPVYDRRKKIVKFDYTALDKTADLLAGKDVVLLLNGIPSFPANLASPAYRESLKTYVEDLTQHLAEKGIDKEHFAFYPVDEPGGTGWASVNRLVEFGKQVRMVDPEIQLYVDGGGENEMFEAMTPVIDIWSPALFMLPEKTPEMEVIHSSGGTLWSYDCSYAYARPVGANLKNINIVGQYRTSALFALQYGATGIGYWCYNIGEPLWGRTQLEYPLVYSGRTKPIPSRRWEAVREGIEDYRILVALKNRLEDHSLSQDNRSRIGHLLEKSLPELIVPAYESTRRGLSSQALEDSANEGLVKNFRKEMIATIEALRHP